MVNIRSCSQPIRPSEAPGTLPTSDLAHALAAFPQQTREAYDTERIRVRALLTTLSQRPDQNALLQAASRVCLPAWSEAERSALLRACAELPPGAGEALRDALPRIPDRLDTDDMIAVVRALKSVPPEEYRALIDQGCLAARERPQSRYYRAHRQVLATGPLAPILTALGEAEPARRARLAALLAELGTDGSLWLRETELRGMVTYRVEDDADLVAMLREAPHLHRVTAAELAHMHRRGVSALWRQLGLGKVMGTGIPQVCPLLAKLPVDEEAARLAQALWLGGEVGAPRQAQGHHYRGNTLYDNVKTCLQFSTQHMDALRTVAGELHAEPLVRVAMELRLPPEAMRPFFILAQAFGYNPGCQDHPLERAMAALAHRGDVITYERARIAATLGLCTSKRSVDYETRSLQRQLCELSRARSAALEAAAMANPGTPQGLPIIGLRRLQILMREHQGPALWAHNQGIRFLRQIRIALR